jgi:hypothetical protein
LVSLTEEHEHWLQEEEQRKQKMELLFKTERELRVHLLDLRLFQVDMERQQYSTQKELKAIQKERKG